MGLYWHKAVDSGHQVTLSINIDFPTVKSLYSPGHTVTQPVVCTSVRGSSSRDAQSAVGVEEVTTPKGKEKKKSISKGRKAKKPVQSQLITHMFSQKAKEYVEELNKRKLKDLEDFDVVEQKKAEASVESAKDAVREIDDDDVIICSDVDDYADLNSQQEAKKTKSESPVRKTFNELEKEDNDKEKDQHISDIDHKVETSNKNKEQDLLTLFPPRQESSCTILTPPSESQFPIDGQEIEEPSSPSDVLTAINQWIEKMEEKVVRNLYQQSDEDIYKVSRQPVVREDTEGGGSDSSEDLPDIHGTEKKCANKKYSIAGITVDAASPLLKSRNTPQTYHRDSDMVDETGKDQKEALSSTSIFDDATVLAKNEVSPVLNSSYKKPLRSNLKLYSSTPKVTAKRLFKIATPDLTAIEQASPLFDKKDNSTSPRRVLCGSEYQPDREKRHSAKRNINVEVQNSLVSVQKNPVRSKLSRFAAPETFKSATVENLEPDVSAIPAQRDDTSTSPELKSKQPLHILGKDTGSVINKCFNEKSSLHKKNKNKENTNKLLTIQSKIYQVIEDTDTDVDTADAKNKNSISEDGKRRSIVVDESCVSDDAKCEGSKTKDDEKAVASLEDTLMFMPQWTHKSGKEEQVSDSSKESFGQSGKAHNLTDAVKEISAQNGQERTVSKKLNKVNNSSSEENSQTSVNFDLDLDDDLFVDLDIEVHMQPCATSPQKTSEDTKVNSAGNKSSKSLLSSNSSLLTVTQIIDLVNEGATENCKDMSENLKRTQSSKAVNAANESFSKTVSNNSKMNNWISRKASQKSNDRVSSESGKEANKTLLKEERMEGSSATSNDLISNKPSPTISPKQHVQASDAPDFSLFDDLMSDDLPAEDNQNKSKCSKDPNNPDLLSLDNFEFMSELLLADAELNMQMKENNSNKSRDSEKIINKTGCKVKTENTFFNERDLSTIMAKMSPSASHVERKRRNLSLLGKANNKSPTSKTRDDSNHVSPTQEDSPVWQRKRKLANRLGSDSEDHTTTGSDLDNSNLHKSSSSVSDRSGSSSFESKYRLNRNKKSLGTVITLDDDDFEDTSAAGYQELQELQKNMKKKKISKTKVSALVNLFSYFFPTYQFHVVSLKKIAYCTDIMNTENWCEV